MLNDTMYVTGTHMSKPSLVVRVGLTVSILVAVFSPAGIGQVPDKSRTPESLVAMLDSPDWQVRSDAIARLNLISASRLPTSYATTIISLLEREATSPNSRGEGEGYGEYLLGVVNGVVRLHDPRSLRGLALLGIQASREAQDYVASQGGKSLPFLDEAWARSHSDAVATTWAYMLGKSPQALSRAERLQVMARLLGVLPGNSRGFTWAAVMGPLPELVPLVEEIASSDPMPARRQAGAQALQRLRPLRDRLSTRDLFARFSDWLDALCSAGTRGGACQVLRASAGSAQNGTRSRLASSPRTLRTEALFSKA